jgi:leucyl/phenylalanyl-tRNA---protein transferase
VPVIDCQQRTPHLASLGAREVPRRDFCVHVAQSVALAPIDWQPYRNTRLNAILEKY